VKPGIVGTVTSLCALGELVVGCCCGGGGGGAGAAEYGDGSVMVDGDLGRFARVKLGENALGTKVAKIFLSL
jgi:hypothetical protein